MALLPYRLFYVVPASGLAGQTCPVSCDLPPVWVPKAFYNPTFRDLSGATGPTTIAATPLLMKTNINQTVAAPPPTAILPPQNANPSITTTAAIASAAVASPGQSLPDDITHADERQSPPHNEDWLVFTDSLGALCGEFDGEIYRSWNNTSLPGSMPTSPAVAPH